MAKIKFDTENENFQDGIQQTINHFAAFTVSVNTYNKNTRMTIPIRLRKLYSEVDRVMFIHNYATEEFFLNFKPQKSDTITEDSNISVVFSKISDTRGSYFITVPAKWIQPWQPKQAQLVQDPDFKAKYKVMLYG